MTPFTGKPGSAGGGLFVPGRWRAAVTPVVIGDPSFIRGLEATFRYNDLIFNDRDNPDRYRINKIDGLFDSDVRDSREINPDRHGETSYQSYYSGKTIVMNGTILAGNIVKMRNMVSDLQDVFADTEEHAFSVLYPNETETYCMAKKSAPIDLAEVNSSRLISREFMVTLRASDPRFYSEPTETITITPTFSAHEGRIYNLDFNREYDDYPQLDQVTITNRGSTSNYPMIKFFGQLENFVIINYTTGERLDIDFSIASGNTLTLDQNKITLVDDNGDSKIAALSPASNLISLIPGDNIIGFGGETFDVSAKVEIYSKSSWV